MLRLRDGIGSHVRQVLYGSVVFLATTFSAGSAMAQVPFYTDDASVTQRATVHVEVFNEFDALQHGQFPDLHQNTDNFKINYGLPFHLEFDLDFPYLSVFRAVGVQNSTGFGDADLGIKWNFRQAVEGSHAPALSASLYLESPTGNVRQQLGSGVADYWLNFIRSRSRARRVSM